MIFYKAQGYNCFITDTGTMNRKYIFINWESLFWDTISMAYGQYTFDQCKQLQILQLSIFIFHFAYWLPILINSFQVGGLIFSGLNPKCMESSFPIAVWCQFGFGYRYRFWLRKEFKRYTFTLIYLHWVLTLSQSSSTDSPWFSAKTFWMTFLTQFPTVKHKFDLALVELLSLLLSGCNYWACLISDTLNGKLSCR